MISVSLDVENCRAIISLAKGSYYAKIDLRRCKDHYEYDRKFFMIEESYYKLLSHETKIIHSPFEITPSSGIEISDNSSEFRIVSWVIRGLAGMPEVVL